MLLYSFYYYWKSMKEEKRHSVNVQLRTKYIKEDVLTIAFVKFRYSVLEFIKHRKWWRSIWEAGDHLANTWLEWYHFILILFILLLKGISFFSDCHKLLSDYFKFVSSICKLFCLWVLLRNSKLRIFYTLDYVIVFITETISEIMKNLMMLFWMSSFLSWALVRVIAKLFMAFVVPVIIMVPIKVNEKSDKVHQHI